MSGIRLIALAFFSTSTVVAATWTQDVNPTFANVPAPPGYDTVPPNPALQVTHTPHPVQIGAPVVYTSLPNVGPSEHSPSSNPNAQLEAVLVDAENLTGRGRENRRSRIFQQVPQHLQQAGEHRELMRRQISVYERANAMAEVQRVAMTRRIDYIERVGIGSGAGSKKEEMERRVGRMVATEAARLRAESGLDCFENVDGKVRPRFGRLTADVQERIARQANQWTNEVEDTRRRAVAERTRLNDAIHHSDEQVKARKMAIRAIKAQLRAPLK